MNKPSSMLTWILGAGLMCTLGACAFSASTEVNKGDTPASNGRTPAQPGEAAQPAQPAQPAEPGDQATPGTTPAAGVGIGGERVAAPAGAAAVGGACTQASDCASGVCEGLGCEAGAGRCVEKTRVCTRDLKEYCGCDGQVFRSSGSCAGRTYRNEGACEAKAPAADGQPCSNASECQSGVCEGEGCGANAGTCQPKARACTRDLQAYCGCDDQEFRASGSCPGRLYKRKGAC